MNNSEILTVLKTLNKLIFDISYVLMKDDDTPFEVGVRVKTPEIQDHIFEILRSIFKNGKKIIIEQWKDDDNYIIAVKKI